jgi:hypothetical protein
MRVSASRRLLLLIMGGPATARLDDGAVSFCKYRAQPCRSQQDERRQYA